MIIYNYFTILMISLIAKTISRVTSLIDPSNYEYVVTKKRYGKN
jgi:hypothetical protein